VVNFFKHTEYKQSRLEKNKFCCCCVWVFLEVDSLNLQNPIDQCEAAAANFFTETDTNTVYAELYIFA